MPRAAARQRRAAACDPQEHVRDQILPNRGLSYNVADLYYANLFKNHDSHGTSARGFDDWDADGDGNYNMMFLTDSGSTPNPDNVDGYPDVALGRVPAINLSTQSTNVGLSAK